MGIDPGLDGAFVIITSDGKLKHSYKFETFIVKDSKRKLDIPAIYKVLSAIFIDYPDCFVAIEAIHGSAGQGSTSIFSMGYSLGALEAIISIAKFPYVQVSPQKWKNRMLSGMPKEKDASVQKALQLCPSTNDILIGKRGGRDHNIADAYLIAEYARITFQE